MEDDEDVNELIDRNDLAEVIDRVATKEETNQYYYSPLNKSAETKLFEKIIHDIIKDQRENTKNIKFAKDNEDNILLVTNKKKIDLKNLLTNVNLNHLSISESDINSYAGKKSIYNGAPSHEMFKKKILASDINQQVSLSQLSYGEMLAINEYTRYSYIKINALTRGQHDKVKLSEVGELLVHTAVASYALNKVPNIELPIVIRNQNNYSLETNLENVKNQNVSEDSSFISAAYSSQINYEIEGGVKIIYKNVVGKSVSALSAYPTEQEYLIPPNTQLKWTGVTKTSKGHIFTVEGANVILDDTPSIRVANEVEALTQYYEKKIGKDILTQKDIKEFITHTVDIQIKHGVIQAEHKAEYYKVSIDGTSKFNKDLDTLETKFKTYESFAVEVAHKKATNKTKIKDKEANLGTKDKLCVVTSEACSSMGFKGLADRIKNKMSGKGKELLETFIGEKVDMESQENAKFNDIRTEISKIRTNIQKLAYTNGNDSNNRSTSQLINKDAKQTGQGERHSR